MCLILVFIRDFMLRAFLLSWVFIWQSADICLDESPRYVMFFQLGVDTISICFSDYLPISGAARKCCTNVVHSNFSIITYWTAICQQHLIVVVLAHIVISFFVMLTLWHAFVLITVRLRWLWIVWKFFIHRMLATCAGTFRRRGRIYLSLEHTIYFQHCLVDRSSGASGSGSWGRCAAST